MKRLFIILLFLFQYMALYGQYRVMGVVKDDAQMPLHGVIVTAYNNNRMIKYAISSENGNYLLELKESFTRLDYYLMGYKRAIFSVDIDGTYTLHKDVVLQEDVLSLPSVTVRPEAIKVQGDTVTYDVISFIRNEDNTLKEILNRLPDVSVTTTGTVKVQGKSVNKFYIENLDLLGGRYALAVNNLKAEDIASVSVYYNHQPIKALQQTEYSEQTAVNIKLKENAKGRWMYELEGGLGAGDELLYNAYLKAMHFGKESQSMFIGKTNNAGDDIISETKLQNMGVGGFNLQDVLSGGVEDLFAITKSSLPVPANYYYDNRSKAVSFLNLNNLASGNTFKEGIVVTTDASIEQMITKEVVMADEIVIVDSLTRNRNQLQVESDFTYTANNDNSYLENKLSFKIFSNSASASLKSTQGGYSIDYSLPKIILDNDLDLVLKSGDKATKLNADFHFSNLDQYMMVQRNTSSTLFKSDAVTQKFYTKNLISSLYSSFIWRKSISCFSFDPGINVKYKEYRQVLDPYVDSLYSSLYLFSVLPYANMKWQYKNKKNEIIVSAPLSVRCDFLMGNSDVYLLYNPYISVGYRLSDSFKLRVGASVGNSIEDIETMSGRYIYTGYRNFYSYSVVPEKVSQNYSVSLNYSNYSSYFFAGLYTNWMSVCNNNIGQTVYWDDYTFTDYIEQDSKFNFGVIGANAKKRLAEGLIMNIRLEYSCSGSEQFIQSKLYNTTSVGYSCVVGIDYEPSDKLAINYEGKVSYSELRGGKGSSLMYYNNILKANWYPIRNILISGEIFHYQNSSLNYNNSRISIPFVDLKLEYEASDKFSISCYVRNMLNVQSYEYSYFSGYSEVVRKVGLRGAEFLLGVSISI